MPLPLLLAGVAGAAIFNHFAREVNDDYATTLNMINDDMEELYEKTNAKIQLSEKRFDKEYDALYKQKEEIFRTTLTKFADTIKHLNKVEFDNQLEKKEMLAKFERNMTAYHDNSTHRGKKWAKPSNEIATTLLFGLAGQGMFFLGNVVRGVRLQGKIDEARAERDKLRAQCEEAELQCTKLDSLSRVCKSAYKTTDSLQMLTDRAVEQVQEIVEKSGYDFSLYSEKEKDSIMIMYNFAMALNDLVCTHIFDDEGKVVPEFQKFVGTATAMME